MERILAAIRSLAPALSFIVVSVTLPWHANGALIHTPAAIILEEFRAPDGTNEFTFLALGAGPWYRYKIYNALGEDFTRSNERTFSDWPSVASRLFGTWKMVIDYNSRQEEYSFIVYPFDYDEITVPFPESSPPHGSTVTSPFFVTVKDGETSPYQSQGVENLTRRYLGTAGVRFDFGEVSPNASIVIGLRTPGRDFSQYISTATSPPNAQFSVRTGLEITRTSTATLFPVNIPEPSGLTLIAGCAAFSSRRLRRP